MLTEKSEIERLNTIYKDLPENKKKVAEGLIVQSARLRIRLDQLWKEIQKKGGTDEKGKERPAAKQFTALDKNYQSVTKMLLEMIPTSTGSKLQDFLNDAEK